MLIKDNVARFPVCSSNRLITVEWAVERQPRMSESQSYMEYMADGFKRMKL